MRSASANAAAAFGPPRCANLRSTAALLNARAANRDFDSDLVIGFGSLSFTRRVFNPGLSSVIRLPPFECIETNWPLVSHSQPAATPALINASKRRLVFGQHPNDMELAVAAQSTAPRIDHNAQFYELGNVSPNFFEGVFIIAHI
jgi:hypothetical protein